MSSMPINFDQEINATRTLAFEPEGDVRVSHTSVDQLYPGTVPVVVTVQSLHLGDLGITVALKFSDGRRTGEQFKTHHYLFDLNWSVAPNAISHDQIVSFCRND